MTRGLPEVNRNLEAWLLRTETGLFSVCENAAILLENYAKTNRSWHDQSSHARQGLKGKALKDNKMFHIFIFHQVNYGVWLELANQGKYAILERSINANIKTIYADWNRVVKGASGAVSRSTGVSE